MGSEIKQAALGLAGPTHWRKHVFLTFLLFLYFTGRLLVILFTSIVVGVQCAEPEPPVNGRMSCSMAGCQISCLPDYRFPVTGATTLTLSCMNGRWMVKDMQINEIPKCEGNWLDCERLLWGRIITLSFVAAICLPACKNNGICIAPGQCRCPQNFMGPTCQFEKKVKQLRF